MLLLYYPYLKLRMAQKLIRTHQLADKIQQSDLLLHSQLFSVDVKHFLVHPHILQYSSMLLLEHNGK